MTTPPVRVRASRRFYILDIDGTLLPTAAVDNRCYWAALGDVFGARGRPPALDGFTNVTDIGILHQWCLGRFGRLALAAEVEAVQLRFLARLRREAEERPADFRPHRGVRRWLAARRAAGDARVALATGGWSRTARFKLAVSGLDAFDLPLASCDDGVERTTIMRHALRRLAGADAMAAGEVCYVGDGIWDFHSTRALGWRFIGIGRGEDAERLRAAGATQVRDDFRALDD